MKKVRINKRKLKAFIGELLAAAIFYAVFVGGALAIIASM